VPPCVVDVADRVFDLVADEAMVDRRTVRDQAVILIEQALGLRPGTDRGARREPKGQPAEAPQ
jgi:hypothetical protein